MKFKFGEDFKFDTYYDISKYEKEKYEDIQYDLSKFVKNDDDIDDILDKIKLEIMIACDKEVEDGSLAITMDNAWRVIDKYYKNKNEVFIND